MAKEKTFWCNICKRHKVAKGNFDKWEIKENARYE